MCSDLLGAVIDRDQCWRPVRHATDISINQTDCERDLPVAMALYQCEVKLLLINETVFSRGQKNPVGRKKAVYLHELCEKKEMTIK